MSRMKKIKKITPYLAASLALIASSAAPTHAATITTGAAIVQGRLDQDPNQVLLELLSDVSKIQNPEQYGLSAKNAGSSDPTEVPRIDFDRQEVPSLTSGQRFESRSDARATGNSSLITASGDFLRGDATARFAIQPTGDLQLGNKTKVKLENGGGSPQNGAIALTFLDFISQFRPEAGQTGNTVNTQFTFDLRGLATDESQSAQSGAAAALRVNGQNYILTGTPVKGATTLSSPVINVPTNTDVDIQLALGSGSVILGSSSRQNQETDANYLDTLRITGIETTNPTTGAPVEVVIGTNVPNPTGGTFSLNQVAEAGAVAAQLEAAQAVPEPPATLGLLVLGAGLVGSTQLKKLKLANKKIAK